MKLTEAFKDEQQKIAEIDDTSLAAFLDQLYNPSAAQISTVASTSASATEETQAPTRGLSEVRASYKTPEAFTQNYQPQINKLCDSLIELCDKANLKKCKEQFETLKANPNFNSPIAFSENILSQYATQNLVKCSLENIYYQMNQSKDANGNIVIPEAVKKSIENAELAECLPGAYSNIDDIRRKFAGELYSYKYDFIRNYASQYISDKNLSSAVYEVHYANSLLYFTSATPVRNSEGEVEYKNEGGYNIKVPTDLYAEYPTRPDLVEENPANIENSNYAEHRKFAVQLDQFLTSSEGATAFTDFVASNVFVNLPDLNDQNLSLADQTTMLNAALKKIKLDTGQIVEYDYETKKMKYLDNYLERINIAAADYLSNVSEFAQKIIEPLKINVGGEKKEIKQTSSGYYIESNIENPLSESQTHYLKLLDTNKIGALTIEGEGLPSFIDKKIANAPQENLDSTLGNRFYSAIGLPESASQYDNLINQYQQFDGKATEEDPKAKSSEITQQINEISTQELLKTTDVYKKLTGPTYNLDLTNPDNFKPEDLLKMQPYVNIVEIIPDGIAQNMLDKFKADLDFDGLAFIAKNFNAENGNPPLTADAMLEKAFESNNASAATFILSAPETRDLITQEMKNNYLIDAAENGSSEVAKALLEGGADIEAKNKYGKTALHLAALRGHTEMVNVLIASGANLDAKDDRGNSALICAAENGHTEIVKELMKSGANKDAKAHDGQTALHLAALMGHTEMVKALIEKGANLDAKDDSGNSALHWAALRGHTEIVKELIASEADKEAQNRYGQTALICAADNGHTEIVKELIASEADKEAQDTSGQTALIRAAQQGHTEIVKELMKSGADKKAQNRYGQTALHLAALRGHTEMVKALIEKGATLDARDDSGNSALHWAALRGHTEIVKELIASEADKEAQNRYGQTALICAAENGSSEVAKALLEGGADIEAKNKYGQTALHWAALRGHTEIVKELMKSGAAKEAQNLYGQTALICAAKQGHTEIVKELIEKGANKDARDDSVNSALHWAALRGHTEMVKALIASGANLDAKDDSGNSALICAAQKGHTEIVKELMKSGADKDARDDSVNSALHWAALRDHIDVVKALLEGGADVEAKNKSGYTALDYAQNYTKDVIVQNLENRLKVKENKGKVLQELLNKNNSNGGHSSNSSVSPSTHGNNPNTLASSR